MALENLDAVLAMAREMAAQMGGADAAMNPTYALAQVCETLVEQVKALKTEVDNTQEVVSSHDEFRQAAANRIEALEEQVTGLVAGQVLPSVVPRADGGSTPAQPTN